MDKNFLPLLSPDFFQKISNFHDSSWSSNKFPGLPGVETLPLLVEIPKSKMKTHQGVIQKIFLSGGSTKKCDHVCHQLGICIEYTYISEFILWLHQGKFVKVKWVKIPLLAPLQVFKYVKQWSNVHEPLKDITYIRKKLVFNFLGANFLVRESSHQLEKQPVLGPTHGFSTSFLGATHNSICIWRFISIPNPFFQERREKFHEIFCLV